MQVTEKGVGARYVHVRPSRQCSPPRAGAAPSEPGDGAGAAAGKGAPRQRRVPRTAPPGPTTRAGGPGRGSRGCAPAGGTGGRSAPGRRRGALFLRGQGGMGWARSSGGVRLGGEESHSHLVWLRYCGVFHCALDFWTLPVPGAEGRWSRLSRGARSAGRGAVWKSLVGWTLSWYLVVGQISGPTPKICATTCDHLTTTPDTLFSHTLT